MVHCQEALVRKFMDFGSERGVDSISDLPDHILCHILSFLPTKFAVASSILATRWRYLWASIPIVDIDTRQHREIYPIFNINVSRRSDITFQNFVSRILLLNGTRHIQKFRLIYDCRHNPGTIRTWFDVAITHNIQELELDLFSSMRGEFVKLPRKLFTSNSLVILKLSRMPLGVPSLVCLPRLKILELRRITYSDDKCIQNLLSGCPLLQDLVVEETAREKPRVVSISISTLRNLSFSYKFVMDIMINCPYKFVINAPNLEDFHIKGRISDHFVVKSLANVSSAHLDLRRTGVLPEDYIFCCEGVCNLFKGMANVKFLTLSSDIIQLLCVAHEQNLPWFSNLTNLAFGVGFDFCWIRLVIKFIECSSHLEVLTLNNKGLLRDRDEVRKTPPQPVPECLGNQLKRILIEEFYAGFKPDAVECLVQHVNILKKLIMYCQCPIMLRTQIDYTL